MTQRRYARIKVSMDILEQALHLPEGWGMFDVWADSPGELCFSVSVQSDQFRLLKEGEKYPELDYIIERDGDTEQVMWKYQDEKGPMRPGV